MEIMPVKEAAALWNLSERRVQKLWEEGRVLKAYSGLAVHG